MAGAEAARPFVVASGSTHPSLIDPAHQMDALFGVTNIPQVVWIDEQGVIIRPAEVGLPMPVSKDAKILVERIGGLDEREQYVAKLRDWAHRGAESEYALTPDEVVAHSAHRSPAVSQAAAHFELAQHAWRVEGFSERTIAHFNAAHQLQPGNITYKRQAYSALGFERSSTDERGDGDDWPVVPGFKQQMAAMRGRLLQVPRDGEDWPFLSDFGQDMANMRAQQREADSSRLARRSIFPIRRLNL